MSPYFEIQTCLRDLRVQCSRAAAQINTRVNSMKHHVGTLQSDDAAESLAAFLADAHAQLDRFHSSITERIACIEHDLRRLANEP